MRLMMEVRRSACFFSYLLFTCFVFEDYFCTLIIILNLFQFFIPPQFLQFIDCLYDNPSRLTKVKNKVNSNQQFQFEFDRQEK